MRYIIKAIPGGYEASIPLPLQSGATLIVKARATFSEVQRDLAKRHGSVGAACDAATVEGFFGDVGRFVKKVTKNKALRKAVKTAGAVVKHPAFSAAVAMIPGVGIPVATGIQAAVAAERLITNATKAPKGSRARIAARTVIKAANAVAKREARQVKAGIKPPRMPGAGSDATQRAFRYLVQLAPATL